MTAREFRFSKNDFELLRKLVNEQTGISLSDHKQEMLYSRLARRLRVLNLDSFASYYALLKQEGGGGELIQFVNAVTTNLTAFFREPHHFDFLGQVLLPELLEKKEDSERIRIWSAGCASGEEVYSIAMIVREIVPIHWDVKILATDLDSNVLEKGREGWYSKDRVQHIPKFRLQRWFNKGIGERADSVQITQDLRDMITFKQLNLIDSWPMKGAFDIIFCRNVVIYFSKETQRILFDRFANLMVEKGMLFIGHSENLFQLSNRFRLVQQTIYRKEV
jgi:chemotaxis protein methyltransferase CheR